MGILKKEHVAIKESLENINESQIKSDKAMESLSQSLKYQNEIINKHFEEDKEFRTQNKELIGEVKMVGATVSSIKLELAKANLQNHELMDGKLNNVYKRVRDLETNVTQNTVNAEANKALIKKEVKEEALGMFNLVYTVGTAVVGVTLFLFWYLFSSLESDVHALENGTHIATKDKITRSEVKNMLSNIEHRLNKND